MNEHWIEWLFVLFFCMTSFFRSHIFERKFLSFFFFDRIFEVSKSAALKNFLPKKFLRVVSFSFTPFFVKPKATFKDLQPGISWFFFLSSAMAFFDRHVAQRGTAYYLLFLFSFLSLHVLNFIFFFL